MKKWSVHTDAEHYNILLTALKCIWSRLQFCQSIPWYMVQRYFAHLLLTRNILNQMFLFSAIKLKNWCYWKNRGGLMMWECASWLRVLTDMDILSSLVPHRRTFSEIFQKKCSRKLSFWDNHLKFFTAAWYFPSEVSWLMISLCNLLHYNKSKINFLSFPLLFLVLFTLGWDVLYTVWETAFIYVANASTCLLLLTFS